MTDIVRREFDTALELVTPPASPQSYRYMPQGTFVRRDGVDYRYDAYLPATQDAPAPVVVFVHGDAPPDVLREPRLWGQYRSWAALVASHGMAAIAFDHASSEGRTKIPMVVDQIAQLLDLIDGQSDRLGVDAGRVAVWSGSAGVPFGFVAALDRPTVRCQVAFYGPMDLRTDRARSAPEVAHELLSEYSPITHLERRRGAISPTFIAKAGLDRPGINDSIDGFVERSKALGAPVELHVHEDGRHAFDILDEGARSRELIQLAVEFMGRSLNDRWARGPSVTMGRPS
jgi:acetyl esterase/lipase